jgi:hypothetical protein
MTLKKSATLNYLKRELKLWHSRGNFLSEQRFLLKTKIVEKVSDLKYWSYDMSFKYDKDINNKMHKTSQYNDN